jgi:polyribonucleotide nucleotidyltransferase
MLNIYFDESGDLGFSQKSSQFFILAFLMTSEPKKIDKAMKKTVANMTKKQRQKIHGYMHAVDTEPSVVRACLKRIDKTDAKIAIYIVDKNILPKRQSKRAIYNELVVEFLDKLNLSGNINFLASRREKAKRYNDEFIAAISRNRHNFTADTAFSWTDRKLQAVDFVAWAFANKYERDDNSFTKCFSQITPTELTR